jgi:hypothetical protein
MFTIAFGGVQQFLALVCVFGGEVSVPTNDETLSRENPGL